MPNYLRFVRGMVDSNDLPLNISREILQQSRDIEAIRAGSVKKVLDLLAEMADNDKEKYAKFWGEFGRVLKEGVVEDTANRERIAKLLRFSSTHKDMETQDVALADYVARMKDGQKHIYYVTADSFAAARHSPHLEIFRQKGIEVLLLHERVDEWLTMHLTEFEGKPLRSVAKGALDLGGLEDEQAKQEQEKAQTEFKGLLERLKSALGERVKDVRVTHRLTSSPACLVTEEQDLSANLERLLKAAGQNTPSTKPILEINPGHPIVARVKEETDEARFGDWSRVLFDQAQLSAGGSLEDPAGFVSRLNALLVALSTK
jgi:molecular chaperone HtpG